MGVLERARKAYARTKAQRNGRPSRADGAPLGRPADCAESAVSAESPSPGSAPLATDDSDDRAGRYLLVDRAEMLAPVLTAIDEANLVALDTETTGLDTRADRVRLLSLGLPTNGGGTFAYLIDAFAVDT